MIIIDDFIKDEVLIITLKIVIVSLDQMEILCGGMDGGTLEQIQLKND